MSRCVQCPTGTTVAPPRIAYQDYYHPQIVQVIHPIEIVNRHHCIPVPVHIVTCTVRDEYSNIPNVSVSSRNGKKSKK